MTSLIKFANISKRVFRPVQLFQRHISTSKNNQEVCVSNAEITEQEPVIFLNFRILKCVLILLILCNVFFILYSMYRVFFVLIILSTFIYFYDSKIYIVLLQFLMAILDLFFKVYDIYTYYMKYNILHMLPHGLMELSYLDISVYELYCNMNLIRLISSVLVF